MSQYNVTFDKDALKQIKQLKKSGKKVDLKRVNRFIEEVRTNPKFGIGHPKPLSHHTGETWSRKINDKDRFVYEIFEQEKTVLVIQVLGHYQDN